MPEHCFTYGSLMCADIMSSVCAVPLQGEPASLQDYARHPVRGEDYPGLVAVKGPLVEGILYRNVPPAAWPRLDAFEGVMYERRRIEVRCGDGTRVTAWAYVFKPAYGHLLESGDWDFSRFLAEGRERFCQRYLGFARL